MKEVDLLPQVIPDDVAVPTLPGRLDDIANEGEHAGELAARRGFRGRRRVECLPASVGHEHLDPGVGVALTNGVVVPEAVVRPADETGDIARRDVLLA